MNFFLSIILHGCEANEEAVSKLADHTAHAGVGRGLVGFLHWLGVIDLHPVGFFRLSQPLNVMLRDEVAWIRGLHPLILSTDATVKTGENLEFVDSRADLAPPLQSPVRRRRCSG